MNHYISDIQRVYHYVHIIMPSTYVHAVTISGFLSIITDNKTSILAPGPGAVHPVYSTLATTLLRNWKKARDASPRCVPRFIASNKSEEKRKYIFMYTRHFVDAKEQKREKNQKRFRISLRGHDFIHVVCTNYRAHIILPRDIFIHGTHERGFMYVVKRGKKTSLENCAYAG